MFGANVSPLSLQLIFFDGEEAIETWSKKDSTYGAWFRLHKLSLRQVAV